MKPVKPADVRHRIDRERRQRLITHLRKRRPDSTRLAFLEFGEALARVADGLRDVARPATAAIAQMIDAAEHA